MLHIASGMNDLYAPISFGGGGGGGGRTWTPAGAGYPYSPQNTNNPNYRTGAQPPARSAPSTPMSQSARELCMGLYTTTGGVIGGNAAGDLGIIGGSAAGFGLGSLVCR